jgi:hypothetical protein
MAAPSGFAAQSLGGAAFFLITSRLTRGGKSKFAADDAMSETSAETSTVTKCQQ